MQNKISKYIMLVVGLMMLLVNAIGYLFDTDIKNPALTVMGLVFVVVGAKINHKK